MFRSAVAAVLLAISTTPALAQIATAGAQRSGTLTAGSGAPVSTDPTADQISAWIGKDAAVVQTLGPEQDLPPLPVERRIHGEVGANVGNRGFGGYGAVAMPLGRASELDLAAGAQHYDYGRYGHGTVRSFSIGLLVDGDDLKNLISRKRCNVPRWGVKLPDDPVVLPDGSCVRPDAEKRARAGALAESAPTGPTMPGESVRFRP